MKIVTVAQMIEIEQASDAAGHTYDAMMELAGQAVAAAALRQMEPWDSDGAVLVLVGPGNNGGDGLVAARFLRQWVPGRAVLVYCWKRNQGGDKNYDRLRDMGLPLIYAEEDQEFAQLRRWLLDADLVIDGLLGTGVSRPISGTLAALLALVREQIAPRRITPTYAVTDDAGPSDALRALQPVGAFDFLRQPTRLFRPLPQVVAVDCPSGLNCDSGALDPAALPTDLTVTFANPKVGHFVVDGPRACGRLEVADIGTDPALAAGIDLELASPALVQQLLPVRPADAHKGTFGRAMVAAGSRSYSGAALLACSAAYRAGSGLVTGAVPAVLHAVLAAAVPEVTWLLLPEQQGELGLDAAATLLANLSGYAALLVGPGLTHTPGSTDFVEELLGIGDQRLSSGIPPALPLVLDADALNVLAGSDGWQGKLSAAAIVTPHPGEMARLCGCSTAQVRAERIELARRKSAEWQVVVLLKGAYTVIAAPDGRAALLPFANPVLATAGSGDVLAGVLVGLLSQGLAPYEAALLGGMLHGLAGELARAEIGDAGVVASDLIARLPAAIRQLRAA